MLSFQKSKAGRFAKAQVPDKVMETNIPAIYLRNKPPRLAGLGELDTVRHFTGLSKKIYSIEQEMVPLGSCTMKYNPHGIHMAVQQPAFVNRHPLVSEETSQGILEALFSLQEDLMEITGMAGVCLTPMAGSQGEFAGVAMIRAYHCARGEAERNEMLIPDAAHGTNPASAVACGFKVIEIPTAKDGDLDLEALKAAVGPKTAGIMLTNPSTLGLFMRQITEVAQIVHEAGGLLYYDGANLNAILGQVRPGDMGFDVMHLNVHKTFATPHGGGGPGAGPIGVSKRLLPYLPLPIVLKDADTFRFATKKDIPHSIGRLSCFMGNVGILLHAYFYIRILGREGLVRVSQYATLNANYLLNALKNIGFTPAYPDRRATHEFTLTLSQEKKMWGVSAMDFAKRLLDYGFHAPTVYFPILVDGSLLIEPTETESKETLDRFAHVMSIIRKEAEHTPELVTSAPHNLSVKRLDDVRAARELDLNYYAGEGS